MNRIVHKLKSRSGATIVFAMAVFVLVSIVSVSMITVPLNAAALGTTQREAEQIRLSLSSAAALIRECVAGKEKKLEYVWDWNTSGEDSPSFWKKIDHAKNNSGDNNYVHFAETAITDNDIFPLLWEEMTAEVIEENERRAEAESKKTVTIALNCNDLSEKYRSVEAELTMNDRYNVTAEYSITVDKKIYTIKQFFESEIVSAADNVEEKVKENGEGEVTGVEYHYDGNLAICWPLEKYKVNA